MLAFEDVFEARSLPSGTWVFMGVRRLPPSGKRMAELVWQALTDAGQKALNKPSKLMTRHELLEAMYQAGINDFRSHKPTKLSDRIRFPVFVRFADGHNGALSSLLYDRRELSSFLFRQRLLGRSMRELLVVEFCDTRNDQLEFRKYSAQYVNGEVSAQFLHVNSHWVVKHQAGEIPESWVLDERRFVEENRYADQVRAVFKKASVDFGRIDFGLSGGELRVWEINTNPSIGGAPSGKRKASKPEYLRKLQASTRELFFGRFHRMLESIDTPADPETVVNFNPPKAIRQDWTAEWQAIQRRQQRRQVLGRVKQSIPFVRTLNVGRHVKSSRDR